MLREEVAVGLRSLNEEDAAAGFWLLLNAVVLLHDWLFFTDLSSEVCLAVDWEMGTQSEHALFGTENPNIDL